jgi:limonene 1,2-monooxygenase
MFGGGPGLLASDALMMGIEPEATRDRMAEALDVILRLFRGEAVTEKTEWYTMRDARVHLMPYTHPHPEVCVASAVTPSGGRLAGKYDLGMLCVAAGESAGFSALDTNWAVANEIAAEHGRTMDRSRLRIVLNLHLADTREQAKENIRFGTAEFVNYFNNNMPRLHVPEGVDPVDWVIENKVAVVGTVDDAIERIEQVYEKQGDFGCLLIQANNWAPWAATKRSYELYARYVMPHFSRVNANRYASYEWVTEHQGELVEKRVAAAQQMFDKHAAEQSAKAAGAIDRPEKGKEAW